MIGWLKCLVGNHDWGRDRNIREKEMGVSALLFPVLLLFCFFGTPKVCDRECRRCGKVKTFDY